MTTLLDPTAALAAPTAPHPHPLARLRLCGSQLVRNGLTTTAFCLLISLVLWLANDQQRFAAQGAYAVSIGLTSWLCIDGGRFFVDTASPSGFPRGWRGLALVASGVCTGFVVGSWAGDTYTGRSTFGLITQQPRLFLYLFLFTLSMGGSISYFFYATGKSNYLAQQLETSRRQAAEAQLKLLQSQLEPHMLFNTLANLRALIALDPQRATRMLDRLVDYLRATLQASRATTHPLRAEFERLHDYLELMAVRMGPRLRFELTLPAALADCPVPTLLLQPLVENSIKHGLEPRIAGGSITVAALRRGHWLVLTVADSGVGITPSAPATPDGFGQTQVRERIAALYGHHAHVTVTTPPEGGTLTTLELPLPNAV